MRISLKQLEVFVAIAKIKNMTQAAETLFLSQSACSMALSTLEKQLNTILFDRHAKSLILNERGRLLLPKALRIIAQVQEAQDLMMEYGQETFSGHLMIGASLTIGNYLLPEIIAHFLKLHPEAKLSLKIANTESMIQQLLKFEVDLAFVEGSIAQDDIQTSLWGKDKLVIISSPKDPLVKRSEISKEDLRHHRWILRERGSGTRENFTMAFGEKIEPFLELGHHEAIKQAVRSGLGISCLSQLTVAKEIESKDLVILKTPFLKLRRNFNLLLHKDKHQTALLKEFIRISKIVSPCSNTFKKGDEG